MQRAARITCLGWIWLVGSWTVGCDQSVRVGGRADTLVSVEDTCTGEACGGRDVGSSDGGDTAARPTDTGAPPRDTAPPPDDTGRAVDTFGGPDDTRPVSDPERDTAPGGDGPVCGLSAGEGAIVEAILQSAVRSLYRTLSSSEQVRPALYLVGGDTYVDDTIAGADYDRCQRQPRRCAGRSTRCFDRSCVRCHAVECGAGSSNWTFRLWAAPAGGSVEDPLSYRTGDWRVEYASAPSVAWELSLTFPDSIRARTEMHQELTVESLRTGQTYDATFRANIEGEKADSAASPNEVRFDLHIDNLTEAGKLEVRTKLDSVARPVGEVVLENFSSGVGFETLDEFTVRSGGDVVEWEHDC